MLWSDIKRILRYPKKPHFTELHRFFNAVESSAVRSYGSSARFRNSIKGFFQNKIGSQAIISFGRKARRPLLVLTGFVLLAMAALVSVILFPVVHFQKGAPVSFRQGTPPTLDPNAADSPSALAAHRLTTLGRLKLDKELISRLSNNLTFEEAKSYAQGRLMLFESLAAQMDADAALFDQDFAKKSCAPAAELRLASTIWELSSFQESHINRLMHLNAATPVGGLLASDDVASAEAIKKLQLRILFRVADAALKASCFDLAYALYKKVVPIAVTVQEMQRAQFGIQSAHERRLENR